jgi:hypothetical protein
MAINFNDNLYKFAMDVFARPITVTPIVTGPNEPPAYGTPYANRAYYDTKETDVLTEDGALFSDSRTYIDIRMEEYSELPKQGDLIDIPFHEGTPGGAFIVSDAAGDGNAGGMITLTLKKNVVSKP